MFCSLPQRLTTSTGIIHLHDDCLRAGNALTVLKELLQKREGTVADADNTFQAVFDVPGLYGCQLNIRDILGTNYEDTVGINVYAREELDVQLQAKWNALTQALWYGDVNTARTFFSTRTTEAYGQLMESRMDILDQMVADMQGIELVRLEGEKAIYDLRIVNDGTPYSFQLEFILDEDGLWRIRAF